MIILPRVAVPGVKTTLLAKYFAPVLVIKPLHIPSSTINSSAIPCRKVKLGVFSIVFFIYSWYFHLSA